MSPRICLFLVLCVAYHGLFPSNAVLAQQVTPAPLPTLQYASLIGDEPSRDATPGTQAEKDDDLDFLEKDIRELSQTRVNAPAMDIAVTSVSRQQSTIGRSPAAVFVITSEMIRRSGATCLPELLRMAPGVSVSKITSHAWAVGIRGGQSRFDKQLLVMIDGRSVYNPFFGGVYWDMQDLLLDDIERIEVIRGPGGTIWGANAVDGVINIMTKKASDTQGAYAMIGGGNYDKSVDAVRVGGSNGKGLSWRLWGKHFERGPGYLPGIGLAWDDWRAGHGGFRVDYDLDRCGVNKLTALGNYYGGNEGQESIRPVPVFPYSEIISEDMGFAGQSVLLRWDHTTDEDSDWSFQTYYDRCFRSQTVGNEMWTTMDFDFQHRFPLGRRHNVIWGLNYRQIHNYAPDGSFFLSFSPEQLSYTMFSGFIQDEIELAEDRWYLTAGTKLERNNFSGFEVQPSIRLLWTPDDRHSVWAAVSRAVSTPALYEENGTLNLGPFPAPVAPTFVRLNGTSDFKSEKLLAYEVGYRTQVTERFSWDLATYFHDYTDYHGFQLNNFFPEDTYWVLQSNWENHVTGRGYGVELSATWDVNERWRLWGFYCYQYMHWNADVYEQMIYADDINPLNQVRLQSSWKLSPRCDFDAVLRYVDNLSGLNVPKYVTMDLRLGWRPNESIEMALVGQNLLDSHHYEFGPEAYGLGATEVRRTVFGQMTWRH
ncbi:MAG: TonB-dependent receptor [Pirellulales bacterium]|nr:TonB-dependent receptor [Pirellulales bacterium]